MPIKEITLEKPLPKVFLLTFPCKQMQKNSKSDSKILTFCDGCVTAKTTE